MLLQGGFAFFGEMIFAAVPIYRIQTIHLDAFQLVFVGTVLEATAFIFEVPTGVVADTFSRRLSVIIGIFLIGAGLGLEGVFPLFGARSEEHTSELQSPMYLV